MITETIKIFRRPEIVTVARESADVIIYGFAYRIWIENTELLLEKIEEKVGEIYLNEQRILMERGSVTLKFQEGDSLLFEEGRITLFADQIEIEMPEEFYQTTMLELEKEKLPFEGFPHYKRSPSDSYIPMFHPSYREYDHKSASDLCKSHSIPTSDNGTDPRTRCLCPFS